MASSDQVIFAWPIASNFGWGIRGLGYALNWPGVAVSSSPELTAELGPDDPRRVLLATRIDQSKRVQSQIMGSGGQTIELPEPVMVAMGNNLTAGPQAFGRYLRGRPTIACPVFEDVEMVKANIENLKPYDAVVVASRWNQEVLADLGVYAKLCHEGVDPVLFNPSVRARQKDGRFRVFSGGKAEWRKGQDLVIEAFKLFAEKHDDALLVASWGSPFQGLASDFEGKWEYGAPPGLHIGRPNYHAWVQKAGIKPHQFEWVEPRPNWAMPPVYANVDVALFPNRCEGGTNFVAMECISSGVPTFIRIEFGQDDLLGTGEIYQRYGTDTFIVESCVDAMEIAYEDRTIGLFGQGSYWTWERHCRQMADIITNA